MKNRIVVPIVLSIVLAGFAISCTKINSPSNFLERFSLNDTIKEINVSELRQFRGEVTVTSSAGEPSPHRREFLQEYDIVEKADDIFNESTFLSKLKDAITEKARNSGARINGGGSGGETFNINYRDGSYVGGIDVIGVRAGNKYKVWCVIRELAGQRK